MGTAPSTQPSMQRDELRAARRVVVKIGSALLADGEQAFVKLAAQVHALSMRGVSVTLVSSGAIALGLAALRQSERPKDLPTLQACAAAGQSKLMQRWATAFAAHGVEVAQILLTHADLRDRRRYLNARMAFQRLLEAGVVPIVNENDTVAVEEIKLGDNDTLAAQVCGLCDAQVVVLLTQSAGLFTADPSIDKDAVRVPVVTAVTEQVRALAGPAARLGTGGMITKLDAAIAAQRHGASTVIAPGRAPDVLRHIFDGDDVGTLVTAPAAERLSARKRWIGTALRPRGTIVVDDGAARALQRDASLLFAGVRAVEGTFEPGDAVNIAHLDGAVFARGIVRLSSADAAKVQGRKTAEAQQLLSAPPDELIHRDDLVIL